MKTLRYSDNQPARKGDTFTAPRWGTCRITGFDKANACAVAVNTSTGEVFDMLGQPTFGESDLIARHAPRPTAHPWAIYKKDEKGKWGIIRKKNGRPVTYRTYEGASGMFTLSGMSCDDHCIGPA